VETTIKKEALLSILRKNRDLHRGVFEEAMNGFQQRALDVLEAELARRRGGGKARELRVLLNAPEDHTRDYDRVITMVDLDVREEITLSESEAAQYVMDDWHWKGAWLKMSSRYAAEATQKSYGDFEDDDG